MSEEDASEKSHEASPKKLEDARKRGEVPNSNDLTTAASYGGLLLAAMAFGAGTISALGGTLQGVLERPGELADLAFGGGSRLQAEFLLAIAAPLAPWFLVPAALALLSVIAQRSLVFAPEKLQPKMSRVSLLSNAKQKFGRSGLFEFAKSLLKLCIHSVVLGIYLSAQLPRIIGSMSLEPRQIAVELGTLSIGLLLIVLLVAAAIGVIDALFQQAEHMRKNRMSRKELTDEMKQSEGDPYMKQQRRDRAMEIATNRMLSDVPEADVIVVNPTHYAVALKWDRMSLSAPICVAKGVDEIAARIREIAMANDVPIHSDPPAARTIFADVDLGEEIRPEHYQAVAAAIRFAERIRRSAGMP